jgi:outer membrane receptor for ferrienterochelin and colicins
MKKKIALTIFGLLFLYEIQAQNAIKGIVVDSYSENPLRNVSVTLLRTKIIVLTDQNGQFLLENLPNGSYVLHVSFDSYETQKFLIELVGTAINLGTILM